ncbi:MAG: ribosome silencing factor [bacterium]|nr:ribosome silencing factor [bacterium]MCX7715980.1 ribosome silencing factor [Endomicrobiia bacterium]
MKKVSARTLAKKVAILASNKKAENIIILDVKKICSFCDYFVIMSGVADIHIKSLTEYIVLTLKKLYGILPHHLEGEDVNRWVVIDYVSVVIHIMLPEVREFYSLEKIWSKGKKVVYERKGKKSIK